MRVASRRGGSPNGWPGIRANPCTHLGAPSPIEIGQTLPYSGPRSGYGTIGRVEAANFRTITEHSGINRRKIRFVALDDAGKDLGPASGLNVSGANTPMGQKPSRRLGSQKRRPYTLQVTGR
jgi:hypothetical protein